MMTLAYTYCTKDDVDLLLSPDGTQSGLDDDNVGTLTATDLAKLTGKGIEYATDKINMWLQTAYDVADLAQSIMVNSWCAIIAARWVRMRRGNPVPESLMELYKETMGEIELVKKDQLQLGGIGRRNVDFPAWSAPRRILIYRMRQLRVESANSERTPVQFPRNRDTLGDMIPPPL